MIDQRGIIRARMANMHSKGIPGKDRKPAGYNSGAETTGTKNAFLGAYNLNI
jgi:hypothetical protein